MLITLVIFSNCSVQCGCANDPAVELSGQQVSCCFYIRSLHPRCLQFPLLSSQDLQNLCRCLSFLLLILEVFVFHAAHTLSSLCFDRAKFVLFTAGQHTLCLSFIAQFLNRREAVNPLALLPALYYMCACHLPAAHRKVSLPFWRHQQASLISGFAVGLIQACGLKDL